LRRPEVRNAASILKFPVRRFGEFLMTTAGAARTRANVYRMERRARRRHDTNADNHRDAPFSDAPAHQPSATVRKS
jgi:hypothetical protein